jgi:energy-coupling factor transport system ATP-binding protein
MGVSYRGDPTTRHAQSPQALIVTQGLEFAYTAEESESPPILRGIDLVIERGEFVALIGANGSGKSTLARHLNALLTPSSGQTWIDGLLTIDPQQTWAIRQRVGMVFQNPDDQIIASTIEQDVAFGPENAGLPPIEVRRRVDLALATVGLTEHRTFPPHMLSGGQKQLTAIAGALATRPAALVFDEPTAMLDPQARKRLLAAIQQLHRQEGLAILLITQSMEEAALAQRILVMHDGQIVLDAPPREMLEHRDRLLAVGLALPPAIEIAYQLRAQGIPLPTNILTMQDLAEALC